MPATSRGEFVYQHPHNLYLEILLDVGLLGFALLAWAFWQAQRALWQLSQGRGFGEQPDLAQQPLLRDYLTGAHAAQCGPWNPATDPYQGDQAAAVMRPSPK